MISAPRSALSIERSAGSMMGANKIICLNSLRLAIAVRDFGSLSFTMRTSSLYLSDLFIVKKPGSNLGIEVSPVRSRSAIKSDFSRSLMRALTFNLASTFAFTSSFLRLLVYSKAWSVYSALTMALAPRYACSALLPLKK